LTSGNSAAAMTLAINGGAAKNIRMNAVNTTTVFSTLAAGAVILLYYDGTYFQMMGSQRTTDTDTDIYDRMYWNNAITAGAAIYDYKIIMQGTDGKFYPLTLEAGTGTTKTVLTTELKIGSPILYYNTTTDVALNGSLSNVYSEFPLANMTYTFNVATWTNQQPVYLKGTVLSNGNFKLDNTTATSFATQTLPTTDDGFVYILLGQMYSTTAMRLFQYHPIYQFKDGALRLYIPTHTHNYEPQLGNPAADGYLLSSTAAGVRSWVAPGSGSGTVTSFSAGSIAGVFTTSVANESTTPALSFTLVSKNANRVFASPDGAAGVPSFRQIVVADIYSNGTTPSASNFLCGNGTWATAYTLPIATASVLGGVKQGTNITIAADGTISAASSSYTLPVATASVLGGVKQGTNITIAADGTISASSGGYTLPVATASVLGGVKQGTGVTIAVDGTLSTNIQEPPTAAPYMRKGGVSPAWEVILGNTSQTATYCRLYLTASYYWDIAAATDTYSGVLTPTAKANYDSAYANIGKVAFHDNFTLIGYLNSSNFSIVGGVISLKLKTINSTSLIGTGDLSLQVPLVSGVNIKTINGASILGAGDITTASAATWGSITGTLSAQTDLQSALNAKAALAGSTTQDFGIQKINLPTGGYIQVESGNI
ncbi:MAG: hypothetical protein JZU49_01330, partial [Sulfuricurvum sp.]|nr:hypothetical protein [Sulfuricurvum sp.]